MRAPRISSPPGLPPPVAADETRISFGRFTMLPERKTLLMDGATLPIGARAFDILQFLVAHRDRFSTSSQIRDHVWAGLCVADNNVSVQIWRLRRCLSAAQNDAPTIVSVPGHGYRFVAPPTDTGSAHAPPAVAPAAGETVRPGTRRFRFPLAALAAGACLGLGNLLWTYPHPPGVRTQTIRQSPSPPDRIATLRQQPVWQEPDDPDNANR